MAVIIRGGSSSCIRVPDLALDFKSAQFRKKVLFCTRLKVCCVEPKKASVNGGGPGRGRNELNVESIGDPRRYCATAGSTRGYRAYPGCCRRGRPNYRRSETGLPGN